MDDLTSSKAANPFVRSPSLDAEKSLPDTPDVEKEIGNLLEQALSKHSPQIENNVERIRFLDCAVNFSFDRWTARANVRTPGAANVSEFRGFPRAG